MNNNNTKDKSKFTIYYDNKLRDYKLVHLHDNAVNWNVMIFTVCQPVIKILINKCDFNKKKRIL